MERVTCSVTRIEKRMHEFKFRKVQKCPYLLREIGGMKIMYEYTEAGCVISVKYGVPDLGVLAKTSCSDCPERSGVSSAKKACSSDMPQLTFVHILH
mmetsp:Transcript_133058/g.265489  ORF Transcript_133058/g.265489 Transcript_133058/m.265489 type:complete len:97 (+) Transcript_133058:429-719(+)